MKINFQLLFVWASVLAVTQALFLRLDNQGNGSLDSENVDEDYKNDLEIRKRGLSVRGDLRALARMLRFQQNKRRQQRSQLPSSHKQLIGLGKRTTMVDNENRNNNRGINENKRIHQLSSALYKRGRLSINGALQSLSEMLASSGRNRLSEEVSSNKNRLLGLGK